MMMYLNFFFFLLCSLFADVLRTIGGGSYTAATNQAQMIFANKVSAWNYYAFCVIISRGHGSRSFSFCHFSLYCGGV